MWLNCLIFILITAVIRLPWIDIGYAADVNALIFQGADYHYKGYLDRAIASFEAAVRLEWTNEYAHNH